MVRGRHKPETIGKNRCIHSHHCNIVKGVGRGLTGNNGDMLPVEIIPDSDSPIQWVGWV